LGADVNLINTGRWMPNDEEAPDPSFEAYANGDPMPGWLTAVGSVVPTVSTTDPQQGTKCLAIPTSASTTRQGVSWRADCIPGQQYTSSVYVRQANASTLRLAVTGQTLGWDEFATPSASTWGTAPLGGAWTNSGGASGDYTVAGGQGLISVSATNSGRFTTLDTGGIDHEVTALLADVVTSVGASSEQGLIGRYTDSGNNYTGYIEVDTSGFVIAHIAKRVGAVLTVLTTVSTTLRVGAGVRARFQVFGPLLKLRVWGESAPEPEAWTSETSDTALTSGSRAGAYARRITAQTSPTVFYFEHLYITGYVASTTTTTTGAYVRLSVTFTATQPQHLVQMTTIGTAIADTVRLDALQHEPGASASTFTVLGPVIYPLFRLNVGVWGREYEDAGFSGVAITPLVDAMAALNQTKISSDYVTAVLDTRPAYFWRLNGGAGTTQALDVSGNGGPFLSRFDSKYGPGIPPEFGAAIDIAGDAGGSGVLFTPFNPGASFGPDSILSLGRTPSTPGIVFPRDYGATSWSVSIAAWVDINVDDTVNTTQNIFSTFGNSAPNATVPIALQASTFGGIALTTIDFAVVTQGSPNGASSSAAAFDVEQGPHLIVGTVTQTAGGNTVTSIYVDGVLVDDTTVTTASLGGIYSAEATYVNVGGHSDGGLHVDGVVSAVVLWERALSASEVTALWTAGGLGNAGELTGTRIARHLLAGGFTGDTRISAGSTPMQPPTWTGEIDLLTDCQNTAVADDGTFWVAPDGAVVFEGRQQRWLRLTSTGTFGESETPYGEGIRLYPDPTYVTPNVKVSRINGDTAVGGTVAEVNAATRKYYGRSYSEGSDYEDDVWAQYKADAVFASHRAPLVRVYNLRLHPSANPTLWPVALSAEIGQRKTVIRRAKAGNAGAGVTMDNDYFIEQVTHDVIDAESGEWRMSFQLSPIGSATTGNGVTFQPWILGDSVLSVLGSTTVLGW
jgi:hypothetical protein